MHPISRSPVARLDPGRIAAGSGAIALNAVLLMMLLTPLVAPPRATREETIDYYFPQPKPRLVEPPPPLPVPVTPAQRPAPRVPSIPAPPPAQAREAVVEPMPGDAVAETVSESVADEPTRPVTPPAIGNAEPVEGAHLEYASAPPPTYPREAIRDGLTGTVMLRVLVDVDGRPLEVSVAGSSGHRVLDLAARRQVLARWRFRPASRDGRAVQAIGVIPVEFTLDR